MKTTWQTKKLSEVCDIGAGNSAPQKKEYFIDGIYPFFRTADVGRVKISKSLNQVSDYLNDEGIKKLKLFKKGTILLPKSGASTFLNHRVVMGVDGYVVSHLATIKTDEKILNNNFLFYFLQEIKAQDLIQDHKYPSLNLSVIGQIKIPLPSLSEQLRIVKILDEVFENIKNAKENTEKNLQNAKELFESYLQSVFANPGEDWEKTTIGKICNLMTGGTPSRTKKEYFKDGEINWLVSGDINKKEIKDCDGRITELGLKNSNAKYLPINSVMIALNGQGKTRGTVAMLRIKATCNQSLVSIYPKDDFKLLPELIYANLEGRYNELRKLTGDTGNDRRGLNMSIIRNTKFSFPKSVTEQKSIVLKLDALSTETKKLEAIYKQKLADLEELKKSVLKKVFNGDLQQSV